MSARSINRLVSELEDHYEDLARAAREQGADPRESLDIASMELGSLRDIGEASAQVRDLLKFSLRYPLAGVVVRPLLAAGNGILSYEAQAVPDEVLRWFAGALFAAVVTASMFLALQLAIVLT